MGATTSRTGPRKPQQQQPEPLRAVLYVRISDDPEGTEKGVDRQEADCRAYAEAHGFVMVEVFREDDTSAFKQRTIVLPSGEKVRRVVRPRFRAMLQMARVLVAMANKSSADTARRVARASRQQALDGKWHGGRAPYGYRMADSTLYVIPERAALAREAADQVLAGESLHAISRVFNERGDRTGNGKLWSETALRQILRNPALKGQRIYRPVLPDGSKADTPEVVTQGGWTPILDPELWEQVGAVLDARKARQVPAARPCRWRDSAARRAPHEDSCGLGTGSALIPARYTNRPTRPQHRSGAAGGRGPHVCPAHMVGENFHHRQPG